MQSGPELEQWRYAWGPHWRYHWQFHWRYLWRYHYFETPFEELPPRQADGPETPRVALKSILQRLLLRREREGFLALDTFTNKVLKLDAQAGEFVQLVQGGETREAAAKKLKVKPKELEDFLNFIDEQDVLQGPQSDG
jgi:hypothetical protein